MCDTEERSEHVFSVYHSAYYFPEFLSNDGFLFDQFIATYRKMLIPFILKYL